MSAHSWLYILVLFILMHIHPVVQAATSISFSNNPTTIDQSQDFSVDVVLLCPSCTSDSYIRGVFYPSGTSYFGYTENNTGTWINAAGGNCTEYFKVTTTDLIEGSWSGKIKVKPDIESSYYNNPGDYLFKIGRYSGGCGSPTWSTETTITITGPTNTPTPTVTPMPTQSPTPIPTAQVALTSTPKPTHTPTSIQKKLSVTPTKPQEQITPTQILGLNEPVDEVVLGTQSGSVSNTKQYIIALLFVSMGLALVGAVLIIKNRLYSNHA